MTASVSVKAWAEKIKSQMRRVTISAARELGSDIIEATPVRTGLARGNWQTVINGNISGPIERLSPTGSEATEELFYNSEKLQLGALLRFANAVPYISDLEMGSSVQAPSFFIRDRTAQWSRYVAEQMEKIR